MYFCDACYFVTESPASMKRHNTTARHLKRLEEIGTDAAIERKGGKTYERFIKMRDALFKAKDEGQLDPENEIKKILYEEKKGEDPKGW